MRVTLNKATGEISGAPGSRHDIQTASRIFNLVTDMNPNAARWESDEERVIDTGLLHKDVAEKGE